MSKQYDPLEELDSLETPRQSAKSMSENKKTPEKPAEKKPPNSGGSWFGGLFSKLAPKPKNQMILPDDNNPAIVWDPVAKKWMNKDEDPDSSSATLAPPPKASDMGFRAPPIDSQQTQSNLQSEESGSTNGIKPVTGSNMFKLPKVRSMRANYIDVMNPNVSKSGAALSNVPTPVTSPLVPMATSSPQLFIPAPVNDPSAPTDFLTPSSFTPIAASTNNSENASQGGPMMYNPSDMKDRTQKNVQPSRYPPR
ncbi:hypothetical protein KM043_014514 [Ampulex compressa]|nr:hypothetical protein KM043_014514 [Ampulex compressa]